MLANQSHPTPPNLINQRLTNLVEELSLFGQSFIQLTQALSMTQNPGI